VVSSWKRIGVFPYLASNEIINKQKDTTSLSQDAICPFYEKMRRELSAIDEKDMHKLVQEGKKVSSRLGGLEKTKRRKTYRQKS